MWLDTQVPFDIDAVARPVFGVAAKNLSHHDSGLHSHRVAQVLFTRRGCVTIRLEQTLCLLPPTRAAWIPAGVRHRAQMVAAVDYRSVYFAPEILHDMPERVEIFELSDLLRAALERIAVAPLEAGWSAGSGRNLLAVCLDEIRAAPRIPTLLPLPEDPRLARFDATALPPSLEHLARDVGAGEKTITRIFRHDTGMSYRDWRQQWRFMKACELLETGGAITAVAQELGFASDSAFIAFFRKASGTTPGAWLRGSTPG